MNRKTNKTAPLLKMLTKNRSDIENPIINEDFKEDVIHIREPKAARKDSSDPTRRKSAAAAEVGINVVEELVQEWLPETLRRFRCADSDVYRAEMTVQALNQLPPKYVYIRSEKDFEALQIMKNQYKNQVINTLVRLVLSSRGDAASLPQGAYEKSS